MDTVRKCIKLSALRQVLSSLPTTLYETYDRILSTIERNGQLDDAVRILQWLCFAKRPQSLKLLVDVLATDIGGNERFLVEERLPDPFDIITVCSSLISIKEETDSRYDRGFFGPQLVAEDPIIQLAHFSVQEYLLSDRCFVGEYFSRQNGHTLLAEISLVYTLHVCTESSLGGSHDFGDLPDSEVGGPVEKAVRQTKRWLSSTYEQYPLSRYTSAWWFKHASEISATASSQRVIEMSIHLFENTDVLARWLKLHDPNPFLQNKSRFQGRSVTPLRHFGQIDTEPRQSHIASPVFYAAATGLPLAVEQLVARGNDVNQMSDQYPAPLHVAVLKGDVSTTASILSNGGNVDARNAVAGTPLQIASASGDNLAMVKLLIGAGATLSPGPSDFTFVNPYDGRLSQWYGTTLDAACYGGSLEILSTLLEAGETAHAPILPKSLLDVVTVGRQHATYQELIVQGQSHIRSATVLHATEWSNVETRVLKQWDLTERPDSSQDYNAVVRLLLSNGLELNEGPWNTHKPADKGFFVLLSEAGIQATKLGDWDEMLCIFGLDSNGPGAFDKLLRFALQPNQQELLDVMLHFALHRNQPELFNKLLTHGADITSVDEYGRNCIDYTAAFPKVQQRFNIRSDKCEPTNPEGRKEILYETTLRNIGKLLWFTSDGTFLIRRGLGRSLIHLGWLEDAVSAFQLSIASDGGPGTRLRHLVACDGCGHVDVETTLRVCRSCKDADLCDPCYKLYQAGLLRDIYLCHGHDFLEVPLTPFCKEYTRSSLTPKVRDWLLELEEKIRRELPVAGSRMIDGEEQKPRWTTRNPWISMQSLRSLRRDCYD
jgi:ankyrin repeat protein